MSKDENMYNSPRNLDNHNNTNFIVTFVYNSPRNLGNHNNTNYIITFQPQPYFTQLG